MSERKKLLSKIKSEIKILINEVGSKKADRNYISYQLMYLDRYIDKFHEEDDGFSLKEEALKNVENI
jgi:hypothetical protein